MSQQKPKCLTQSVTSSTQKVTFLTPGQKAMIRNQKKERKLNFTLNNLPPDIISNVIRKLIFVDDPIPLIQTCKEFRTFFNQSLRLWHKVLKNCSTEINPQFHFLHQTDLTANYLVTSMIDSKLIELTKKSNILNLKQIADSNVECYAIFRIIISTLEKTIACLKLATKKDVSLSLYFKRDLLYGSWSYSLHIKHDYLMDIINTRPFDYITKYDNIGYFKTLYDPQHTVNLTWYYHFITRSNNTKVYLYPRSEKYYEFELNIIL